MTDNELAVLLKHGTKAKAMRYWWGKTAKPGQLWELNIVQHWANGKVPLLKDNK